MRKHRRLVRRAHQPSLFMQDPGTRRVIIHTGPHVLRQPIHENIAKLVAARDRLVIDHVHGRDPPRLRIVGKDQELSVGHRLVSDEKGRFLHVADNDARALGVEGEDGRGEGLA